MKQLDLGPLISLWLNKDPSALYVGVGYEADSINRKQVVKLIAWLVKALVRMK